MQRYKCDVWRALTGFDYYIQSHRVSTESSNSLHRCCFARTCVTNEQNDWRADRKTINATNVLLYEFASEKLDKMSLRTKTMNACTYLFMLEMNQIYLTLAL